MVRRVHTSSTFVQILVQIRIVNFTIIMRSHNMRIFILLAYNKQYQIMLVHKLVNAYHNKKIVSKFLGF